MSVGQDWSEKEALVSPGHEKEWKIKNCADTAHGLER